MSQPGAMRIGTAEREQAVGLLGDHFAAGRITADEYEQRVGAATTAATRADVAGLFRDLPQPHPPFLAPPPPPVPMPPYPMVYPAGYSHRSRVVAGVLNIVIPFGIGRFYTGNTGLAVGQLLVGVFTGVGVLWSVIDGILLLANGGVDGEGRPLRD